jgi:hypothetical protein
MHSSQSAPERLIRRLRFLATGLILAGCLALLGLVAPSLARAWPVDAPESYKLSDVTIEYSKVGWFGYRNTLSLCGDGRGFHREAEFKVKPTFERLRVPPSDVLKVLQLCYESYFFEYRPSFEGTESVWLDSTGIIGPTARFVSDAGCWILKVRIQQYEKRVTFLRQSPGSPPVELLAIADTVEAIGRRLGVEMRPVRGRRSGP